MKHYQPKPTPRMPSYQSYRPSRVVSSSYRTKTASRNRPKRFTIGFLGVVGIASILFVGGHMLLTTTVHAAPSVIQSKPFAKSINTILTQNSQYQIGVALTDISTGQTQSFGQAGPYEAASTAKIITACAYYHLVETGQAHLTDTVGDYTAAFQLKEMVNDSDNDSWADLIAAIGDSQLQAYATSIGIPYNEANNTLTPTAMAQLLSKLYAGKLLNTTDTAQLLSYMQHTNDEELIPAALPPEVTVYHKYGLLGDDLHDASIVVYNGHAYSFVVYTKDSTGYSDNDPRIALIHQLTRTVIQSVFPNIIGS